MTGLLNDNYYLNWAVRFLTLKVGYKYNRTNIKYVIVNGYLKCKMLFYYLSVGFYGVLLTLSKANRLHNRSPNTNMPVIHISNILNLFTPTQFKPTPNTPTFYLYSKMPMHSRAEIRVLNGQFCVFEVVNLYLNQIMNIHSIPMYIWNMRLGVLLRSLFFRLIFVPFMGMIICSIVKRQVEYLWPCTFRRVITWPTE